MGKKSPKISYICRIIYESMGWDKEYSYRIPCQIMQIPMPDDTVQDILIFDLDNYIGRAVNKKDEIIIARKQAEMQAVQNEDAKSFYYPPEDDDEPQELMEIAEQVQREFEISKKIFGIPAFKHTSAFRSIGSVLWCIAAIWDCRPRLHKLERCCVWRNRRCRRARH